MRRTIENRALQQVIKMTKALLHNLFIKELTASPKHLLQFEFITPRAILQVTFYLRNRLLLFVHHGFRNLRIFKAKKVGHSASILGSKCDECQCSGSNRKHIYLIELSHEFWMEKFVAHGKIKMYAVPFTYAIFTFIFT